MFCENFGEYDQVHKNVINWCGVHAFFVTMRCDCN